MGFCTLDTYWPPKEKTSTHGPIQKLEGQKLCKEPKKQSKLLMELCLGLSYILDHEFSGELDVSRCDRLVVNEFPPFHHGSVPSVSYWLVSPP